jgi:hypothetical protein
MISSRLTFVPTGGGMMNGFRNYLFSKGIANDKSASFYVMWVNKYLEFQKARAQNDATDRNIGYFIKSLGKNYLDWQISQANEAVPIDAL